VAGAVLAAGGPDGPLLSAPLLAGLTALEPVGPGLAGDVLAGAVLAGGGLAGAVLAAGGLAGDGLVADGLGPEELGLAAGLVHGVGLGLAALADVEPGGLGLGTGAALS
jgi:hypothetical protein